MEMSDRCPTPYGPLGLWWLLHHPHGPPDPDPWMDEVTVASVLHSVAPMVNEKDAATLRQMANGLLKAAAQREQV